jgi:hypothetical protein
MSLGAVSMRRAAGLSGRVAVAADGLRPRDRLDFASAVGAVVVKMRRASFSWLMALLLLLAQHGALLHELSHYGHSRQTSGTTVREDGRGLESGLCLTCEAYSQVTNPATAGVVHVPLSPAALIPIPEPRLVVVAANAPTPRSRGPPQV